jgi:hypothetical protein
MLAILTGREPGTRAHTARSVANPTTLVPIRPQSNATEGDPVLWCSRIMASLLRQAADKRRHFAQHIRFVGNKYVVIGVRQSDYARGTNSLFEGGGLRFSVQ